VCPFFRGRGIFQHYTTAKEAMAHIAGAVIATRGVFHYGWHSGIICMVYRDRMAGCGKEQLE